MKKRLTSLTVAIAMVATIVLGSVGSVIGFAAVIDKAGYPLVNNRENIMLDYSSTGASTSDISVRLITTDNFTVEDGVLKVTQNHINGNAYFRYKTVGRDETAIGMSIHIDNSANSNISLGFVPHLDSTFTVANGAKYYLISDAGVYEEFTYDSKGTVNIPAGYIGKIAVPFSNFSGIDTKDITGFRVNLTNVPKDESKQLIFDNFTYIGTAYESGEISPAEFPYTLNNKWDEYDYSSTEPFTPVGSVVAGAFTVKNGKFYVGLDAVGAGNGFKAALSPTYSASYEAAYFVVDPSEVSTDIMIKAVWDIEGNTCTVAMGKDYYVRLSDGRVYKYQAASEGEIKLPPDIQKLIAEVAVPYDSMVLSGTSTGAGKPDIKGVTITLDGLTANGTNQIGFSDIGYVKNTENGFIIPPVMTGTVVPESGLLVDPSTESKLIFTGAEEMKSITGCETGVDQRDISYEGGKLGIPISGNPSFSWSVTGANGYQGITLEVDIIEAVRSVDLSLTFTSNKVAGVIKSGGIYYLKSDHDGLYYQYVQTEAGAKNGTIDLPMNFKGKIIIPFESIAPSGTTDAYTFAASTTLKVEMPTLNGTNKKTFIRFSNVTLVKSEEWIGDNAYKIETGVSNIKLINKAEWDLSQPNPESDSNKAYIWKDYTDFYIHSFTTESAYSGTAQKITATQDFTSRNIISGNQLNASWTNYGVNAVMMWIDASHAPNAAFQMYTGGYDKDGNSLSTCWLNADSKIFLYNEKLGKSKLATVNGQELILDGYKGWVIFPVNQFGANNKPFSCENYSLKPPSNLAMNVYIGGMKEGDYIIVDQSQAVFLEAPSVMKTWLPDIGYLDTDTITGNTYMPLLDGTYLVNSSAATGVDTIHIVYAVAAIGTVSLAVGIFAGKRRKKEKSR